MKKKAAISVIIIMLMSLLFAACAGETGTAQPQQTPQQDQVEADTQSAPPEEDSAPESDVSDKVATAEDMTVVEDVTEEGMTPVYADSLNDGTYPVVMKSSSSMFKADHCELVVADGEMQAVLYMTSKAYIWMFAGTAEQAAAADEAELIPPVETEDGEMKTFTLPLGALDEGEPFAAYSKNKDLWYDRTLLFRADSLPAEAFVDGFFTTAESLGLENGEYSVEVSLSGGSGRASVTSPTKLSVADGECTALIEWSSPNYDYMKVDDVKYLPLNPEGNSAFEIPVSIFDRPIQVLADTTAMSQPHEIEYTLTFDSSTIQPAQ